MAKRNVTIVLNDEELTEVVVRAKGKTSACHKLFRKRYYRCVQDGDVIPTESFSRIKNPHAPEA